MLLLQLLVITTIIGSTQDSGTPCFDCVSVSLHRIGYTVYEPHLKKVALLSNIHDKKRKKEKSVSHPE